MKKNIPININTVGELNDLFFLPPPKNSLVTLINLCGKECVVNEDSNRIVFNFFSIWIKKNTGGKLGYGQRFINFDKGSIVFQAPGQIVSVYDHHFSGGWVLAFHPDFIQNYPLAKTINNFDFFSYTVYEALPLSEKEEEIIVSLMEGVFQEFNDTQDKFSHDIAVLKIEMLLNYANRFYHHQFPISKIKEYDLLSRTEFIIQEYFDNHLYKNSGLLTVKYVASKLNLSPHYLGDTLKSLTGITAQQHIQNKLIEKSKIKLGDTTLSVSEIAYELGFEHLQSFSRLFKKKTGMTPLDFRESLV